MMTKITRNDDAVSEIVGEMLMLTVVLVLLALFSTSLSNYLPPPRDPCVTIKMSSSDPDLGNVTLYHQGGDIIKKSDLVVIVGEKKIVGDEIPIKSILDTPSPEYFGLGDTIDVSAQEQDEITLATTRTVLFKGTATGT